MVIENPARLRLKDRKLEVYSQESPDPVAFPIEDLATVVIACAEVSVSAPVLSALAAADVTLVTCDDKYTPNGLLLPLSQHFRAAEVLSLQVAVKRPVIKRCWQQVVQAKISNQCRCLQKLERGSVDDLSQLIPKVASGDGGNVEAHAARLYWPALFGAPFRRRADIEVNAALNYGYAILRSAVARGVVARGLHPALGLHHHSQTNGFNLVDDFMEPFRPLVDEQIAGLFANQAQPFDRGVRQALVGLLHVQVVIAKEAVTVLRAIEIVASSYVESLRTKQPLLELPELIL